jgi:hypothetical protein
LAITEVLRNSELERGTSDGRLAGKLEDELYCIGESIWLGGGWLGLFG